MMKGKKQLSWTRSEDGFTESKDGRFRIEPFFNHATTPQGYDLYDRGERVKQTLYRQSVAKAAARSILRREAEAEEGGR